MADKNQENAAEVATAAASEDKSSSSNGMNILYIVLAVIAALVVIYLLCIYVCPPIMEMLKNSFGSSPEYQLSDAFGIVN
jgi:Kef-type K+ transport system membrane component KefB